MEVKDYIETINGVSFKMIFIKEGRFLFGDAHGEIWKITKPISGEILFPKAPKFIQKLHDKYYSKEDNRKKSITKKVSNFYLGEFPVTQELWEAVMGKENNPSHFKGSTRPVDSIILGRY